MTFLITTNEPPKIRLLLHDYSLEVPMNFDMLMLTNSGKIGIERKAIPGDLISSVTDGRLSREIRAMREETDIQIVLLHGRIKYHQDGRVNIKGMPEPITSALSEKKKGWTREGINNLIRTLQYMEGCYIEVAETDEELVDLLQDLESYFNNTKHLSMKLRPALQSSWNMPNSEEQVMYFYQGIPEISASRAKALCKKYPHPLDIFSASIDDLDKTYVITSNQRAIRFGPTLATTIYNFLRKGECPSTRKWKH